MTMLEGLYQTRYRIHKGDTLICDGMALVQSLLPHYEHLIFRNMAEMLFKHIFQKARNITDVKTVHEPFDRYSKSSLKMQTRNERGDSSTKNSFAYSWRFGHIKRLENISFSGLKQRKTHCILH